VKILDYDLEDRNNVSDLICEADKIEIKEKSFLSTKKTWFVTITIDNYRIEANASNEDIVWVKEYWNPMVCHMKEIKSPLLYASIVTDIIDGYLVMEKKS
tara:strand:- start:787 stop:1086 length:300 start_codon:yes stop_codon:yes gene_type:complete